MSSPKIILYEQLKNEGFDVKVTDGGILANLQSRKFDYQELLSAVPELEGLPTKTVGSGVLIQVGEEGFSI